MYVWLAILEIDLKNNLEDPFMRSIHANILDERKRSVHITFSNCRREGRDGAQNRK